MPHNVIDPGADSVVSGRVDGSLLGLWSDPRFRAGPQSGTDEHALGAQRQRGRRSATVGDTTGGRHQRRGRALGDQVDDVGHERKRGTSTHSVPARLAALRHDDVGADRHGTARLREGLHLDGKRNIRTTDAIGEFLWVTERQHDRGGSARQGDIQQLGIAGKAPGDEPDANPGPLRRVELALQPIRVAGSRRRSDPARRPR